METEHTEQIKKLTVREKIENALIEELKFKQLSEITVADITEKANVSKSTFYRNYHDIFEIYEKMVSALIERCIVIFNKVIITKELSIDVVKDTIRDEVFAPGAFPFTEADTFIVRYAMEYGDIKMLRVFYKNLYDAFYTVYENRVKDKESLEFYCAFFIRAFISCFLSDFICRKSFNINFLYLALDIIGELKVKEEILL